MLQLIVALGLTLSASAEAPDETLRFILDGHPAVPAAADVRSARADLRTSLSLLPPDLELETPSANCIRFAAVLNDVTDQISTTLNEARSFRQRLLVNALISLITMFQDGAEGGYGTLDMRPRSCAWRDRELLKAQMRSIRRQITDYSRNVLGGAGLRELDASEEELLTEARRNESSRRTREWAVIGGATAASIVFWGYAPAGVAVIARVAGGLPGFLEAPAVAFGIRSSAFAAEGLAVYWLQESWAAPENDREPLPPSWDGEMESLELLLGNPDLPELHLLYLSEVRAQLARLYEPWLTRHRSEITRTAEMREAGTRVALASLLGGLSIAEQNVVLANRLQSLGYRTECARGMVTGVSPFDCAIGLRRLVRAIGMSELPANPPAGAILSLTFTADRSSRLYEDLNGVRLDLPAVVSAGELIASVSVAVEHPLSRKHLQRQRLFDGDLAALRGEVPLPIEFSEGLDRPAMWAAVRELRDIAAREPALFSASQAETLRIAGYFAPVYEDGGRLVQTLSAYASTEEMENALRIQPAGAAVEVEYARERRAQSEEVAGHLQKEFGYQVSCTEQVRSQACLRSMRDLEAFLSWNAKDFQPPARAIVITGRGEIERQMSFENAGTLLAVVSVREDVRLKDFLPLAREQGWLAH